MISTDVFDLCTKNGLTIAFAESMTGGSLAYEMIKNPGSSKVISGSIIAYSVEQTMNLLRISEDKIKQHLIVSEVIAKEMATSVKSIMKSDIGVGVTGNAGPDKQENTRDLEVWIAIDFKGNMITRKVLFGNLTRLQAIKKTVHVTYEMLKDCF